MGSFVVYTAIFGFRVPFSYFVVGFDQTLEYFHLACVKLVARLGDPAQRFVSVVYGCGWV